jgi:hypothetical protein
VLLGSSSYVLFYTRKPPPPSPSAMSTAPDGPMWECEACTFQNPPEVGDVTVVVPHVPYITFCGTIWRVVLWRVVLWRVAPLRSADLCNRTFSTQHCDWSPLAGKLELSCILHAWSGIRLTIDTGVGWLET